MLYWEILSAWKATKIARKYLRKRKTVLVLLHLQPENAAMPSEFELTIEIRPAYLRCISHMQLWRLQGVK